MKEICQDEKKEDKRAGNNGDTLRYISFDSKKHLLSNCPYSWENMVIITDSGSNNKEDNMLSEATVINDTIFLSSKEEENILRGFG